MRRSKSYLSGNNTYQRQDEVTEAAKFLASQVRAFLAKKCLASNVDLAITEWQCAQKRRRLGLSEDSR